MHRIGSPRFLGILLGALALAGARPSQAQYAVSVLSADGVQQTGYPKAADGQQVGTGTPGGTHAVLWSGSSGSAIDLHPSLFLFTQGQGIGDGQQVGFGGVNSSSSSNHALLWTGSAAGYIDLNPTGYTTIAMGVSGGIQVGYGNPVPGNSHGGTITYPSHALFWSGSASSMVDLHPAGFADSFAYAVSGGREVGYGDLSNGNAHALMWSLRADTVVDLNPSGFDGSAAYGIRGIWQVGCGSGPATAGATHALLWTGNAASVVDLHPTSGLYSQTCALDVCTGSQVGYGLIGDASTGHYHALLWSGTADNVLDLNQFLPAGYSDAKATGIDAQGHVVGIAGGPSLPTQAVLWVPTVYAPVPSVGSVTVGSNVPAGSTTQATVTLDSPAPAGGTIVSLFSDNPAVATIPDSVIVPAGSTNASVTVTTYPQAANITDGIYAAAGDTTCSARFGVVAPLAVLSLSVNPTSIIGSSTAQATINLNMAAPAGGTVVTLSSSNPSVASLPASITVPAGAASAPVPITTSVVKASTSVTFSATCGGGITQTATLTVSPDALAIQKVEYSVSKHQLLVQATSSSLTATLKVYVASSGALIGTLTNVGGGKYQGQFAWSVNPQNITVKSSLGGSANSSVISVS